MELLTNIQYAGSNLRLMHAHHTISPIFHLRWLKSAAIVDCNDVGVVVLGPVQQMVVLKRVKKATVSVICPRIWVEQCEDVQLFANCECAVMIVGDGCSGIQLAPYNVFYDGLNYELDKAKVQLRQWRENSCDKPIIINSIHSSNDSISEITSLGDRSGACWSALPAKHFYIQPTPFCENYHSSFYKQMVHQLPKKRLVIWPKGSFLFNTNFSTVPLNLDAEQQGDDEWDSITLALRLLYYHFHNKRSRIISYEEWSRVAVSKMRFSPEFARVIFLTAQAISPLDGADKWTGAVDYDLDIMQSVKADLSPILAIISIIGCKTRSNGSSIVRYLRTHMERICELLLLCHYDLAFQHIKSQKYTPLLLNHLPIPAKALAQLDVIFEGTYLLNTPSSLTSTVNIIPHTCSSLLYSTPELNFSQLVEIMCNSLQADMFLLDVDEKILQPTKSVRSITSTQFAEHRKISVRNWQHMELLTNIQYAGSNLRLMHAHHTISPIFHLRWLKSAAIVDCNDVGVVVLGPVQQMVVLKRVKKATVSVICPRIWVEQCEDVQLFANCECAVMIVGDGCSGIQLAPYNVFYDGLNYELDKAKVQLRQWRENSCDKPIIINSIHSSNDSISEITSLGDRSGACWSALPAKHFYIQPTPFCENYHSSFYKTFLSSIPPNYEKEWFEVSRPLAVQSTVKQNSLSNELNKQFLRDDMPFTNTDLSYLLRRVDRKT